MRNSKGTERIDAPLENAPMINRTSQLKRLSCLAPLAALLGYAGCSSDPVNEQLSATAEEESAAHAGTAEQANKSGTKGGSKKKSCAGIASRGDIAKLPGALKSRICELAERPSAYAPMTSFSEADAAEHAVPVLQHRYERLSAERVHRRDPGPQ